MRITAALCALFLTAPVGAAVNLINDGSFELNPAEKGGYNHFAGNTSFDGGSWHVTGVDILHVDTAYQAGGQPPLVFEAQDGRNSLDLTGTGNSGPADGIYQDIATVAGQVYTLSFYVGHATSTGSLGSTYGDPATMRVSIGGGPVQDFVNDDRVTSGIAWKQFTETFTATGDTTRIAFTNGLGNDYLGLDDVSLTNPAATPEPASWMMAILGFGAIGTSLRRARRQYRGLPILRG
jgi:hypothetical protein